MKRGRFRSGDAAMPMHDWTKVEAGIFHAFHHGWISALADTLNGGDGFDSVALDMVQGVKDNVLGIENEASVFAQ